MAMCEDSSPVYHQNPSLKQVNKALNSGNTRCQGLKSLAIFLNNCSDENFVEHCAVWMHSCVKYNASSVQEITTSCSVLCKLLKIAKNFPELLKSVSYFIVTRFFDQFHKHLVHFDEGWLCLELCLSLYGGSCGTHKDMVEKKMREMVSSNTQLTPTAANCFALLPCVGGGGTKGINYKTAWKIQCQKTIEVCQDILNALYVGMPQFQDSTSNSDLDNPFANEDPTKLSSQLHNYCNILQVMLLKQFPVVKIIPIDGLMGFICQGLAVFPTTLSGIDTPHFNTKKIVLPQVYCSLLSLLEAAIVSCSHHLYPYAHLICKLVKQTLDWTGQEQCSYGKEKSHSKLRIAAYQMLSNWLLVGASGSCAETISKHFLQAVLSDVYYKSPKVILQGGRSGHAIVTTTKQVDATANGKLCYISLKTLSLYLQAVGHLLKPEEHRMLQSSIVSLILDFQKSTSPENMLIPYSIAKCRESAYSVLVALTLHPSPRWHPPTQFALGLLAAGQGDPSPTVTTSCIAGMSCINNILHSGFTGSTFPVSGKNNIDGFTEKVDEVVPIDTDELQQDENPSATEVDIEEIQKARDVESQDAQDEESNQSEDMEESQDEESHQSEEMEESQDKESHQSEEMDQSQEEQNVVESHKLEEMEESQEEQDVVESQETQDEESHQSEEMEESQPVETMKKPQETPDVKKAQVLRCEGNDDPTVVQLDDSSQDGDTDKDLSNKAEVCLRKTKEPVHILVDLVDRTGSPSPKRRKLSEEEFIRLSPSSNSSVSSINPVLCDKLEEDNTQSSGRKTPQGSGEPSKRTSKEKSITPKRTYNLRSSPRVTTVSTHGTVKQLNLSPVSEGADHESENSSSKAVSDTESVTSVTTRSKSKLLLPVSGPSQPPESEVSKSGDIFNSADDEDIMASFDESINPL